MQTGKPSRVIEAKKTLIIMLAICVLLVGGIASYPKVKEWYSIWQWTNAYSKELSAAIVRYYLVTTSWESFQHHNQTSFGEVATGAELKALQANLDSNSGSHRSWTNVNLEQVKVLSYTVSSAYVEAIVHLDGTIYYLGNRKTENVSNVVWSLFVLADENGTWKIADGLTCSVPEQNFGSQDCNLPTYSDLNP